MTIHADDKWNENQVAGTEPETLGSLLRELLDLIDESVAGIPDTDIENELRWVLDRVAGLGSDDCEAGEQAFQCAEERLALADALLEQATAEVDRAQSRIKAVQQVAARITARAERTADIVDPADHGRVVTVTATTTASKKTTEAFDDFTEGFGDVSERYRVVNERLIESGKKTSNAVLDSYERAIASYVDFRQQLNDATQLDWVTTVVKAQNEFITEVTTAYNDAVRDVLK